ncbi:hypothetical protein psal_cds_485 [Pandoravirus salinus]|uniref:Uncharacterized protein n=1 Tax=Pandoravirus salinus TaxID=1349410 RepID=S4VXS7_9VIRU|nr:hypothetical protein psal_cds_485 [Pandoravirus salinus]AGO84266.1 hypothetical protein psal_cds_485 [Pandoravirus salinus]
MHEKKKPSTHKCPADKSWVRRIDAGLHTDGGRLVRRFERPRGVAQCRANDPSF